MIKFCTGVGDPSNKESRDFEDDPSQRFSVPDRDDGLGYPQRAGRG